MKTPKKKLYVVCAQVVHYQLLCYMGNPLHGHGMSKIDKISFFYVKRQFIAFEPG